MLPCSDISLIMVVTRRVGQDVAMVKVWLSILNWLMWSGGEDGFPVIVALAASIGIHAKVACVVKNPIHEVYGNTSCGTMCDMVTNGSELVQGLTLNVNGVNLCHAGTCQRVLSKSRA